MHSNGTYDNNPYLKILEQPQEYFRFRYKSERQGGTHGYLQGITTTPNLKTYPTVELRHYAGAAVIKCQLYQHDKDVEHPHTLHEEDKGDIEPKADVSEEKGYIACFEGLGIIHTAKKAVRSQLYNKLEKRIKNEAFEKLDDRKLRDNCKKLDLNRVRLRFSAHDATTDKEVCEVYSNIIYNMKSSETNKLEICRYSRVTGSASGDDPMMFFVEKINKGNVRVNFFELNSEGERVWETQVHIQNHNVHRQYGIYFCVPPYRDERARAAMAAPAHVWMELQRVSDGRRSAPRPFAYTPAESHLLKMNPRASQIGVQVSDYSILTPLKMTNKIMENPSPVHQTSTKSNELVSDTEEGLEFDAGDAFNGPSLLHPAQRFEDEPFVPSDPGNVPVDQLTGPFNQMPNDASDFEEFMREHLNPLLSQNFWESEDGPFMPLDPDNLHLDSDKPQLVNKPELEHDSESDFVHFKSLERLQIQKLIKDICELKSEKLRAWYKEVTEKLNRLFEIRLNNGETILHVAARRHAASCRRLAALAGALGLRRLLGARDRRGRTALHVAARHRRAPLAAHLVRAGCDPLVADVEGNSAIHYAEMSDESTLAAILDAVAHSCDHDEDLMRRKLAHTNRVAQHGQHEPRGAAGGRRRVSALHMDTVHDNPGSAPGEGSSSYCEGSTSYIEGLSSYNEGSSSSNEGSSSSNEGSSSSSEDDFHSADEGDPATLAHDITERLEAVRLDSGHN